MVELQEATELLFLVVDLAVVVALETQTNIEMVVMGREIKVDTMATSVMSIALFSRLWNHTTENSGVLYI